jgi:hypothetical protein
MDNLDIKYFMLLGDLDVLDGCDFDGFTERKESFVGENHYLVYSGNLIRIEKYSKSK